MRQPIDSGPRRTLDRVGIWIALGACVLIDMLIGLPLLVLGMDFHFGALGFITLASLLSPFGLVIVSGFVVLQGALVVRLIQLNAP